MSHRGGAGRVKLFQPRVGAIVRTVERLRERLGEADLILHDDDIARQLTRRNACEDPGDKTFEKGCVCASIYPGPRSHYATVFDRGRCDKYFERTYLHQKNGGRIKCCWDMI